MSIPPPKGLNEKNIYIYIYHNIPPHVGRYTSIIIPNLIWFSVKIGMTILFTNSIKKKIGIKKKILKKIFPLVGGCKDTFPNLPG